MTVGVELYRAEATCRSQELGLGLDWPQGFDLEIHEEGPYRLPLCGTPVPDSYHGRRMYLAHLGAGPVTCKSCAKKRGIPNP